MTDFLLELRSEEIPARMQVQAKDDLARLFAEEIGKAGLVAESIETFATPRRLALIAHGLSAETAAVSEERKGPRANAPEAALAGFLRSTGLTREQLVERDGVFFAIIDKPGRPTANVLAEAIPTVIRAFPWPKSMRWGTASASTESLRWVRPLQGIIALFGDDVVPFEVGDTTSGRQTAGHRFMGTVPAWGLSPCDDGDSPQAGTVPITSPAAYVETLRAAHVIVHLSERTAIIRDGAQRPATAAGLTLVEDEGLVAENAGLTEWPVPLLGRFDAAFLGVPREVIQLTMRTNQKYFACVDADGALANAFICTANIDAHDGGTAIVAGNERVLSARLSDAKFFWENDLKVPLADQTAKLGSIVFHEKLGTVADKVERVAKLARWLCEEGIVHSSPERGGGTRSVTEGPRDMNGGSGGEAPPSASPPPPRSGEDLATLAETAARLCKADLVTGMVGEFPELQGIIGGHLARAQGLGDAIADAIRDHYKPVGAGDDAPTAPVTVAVSLADKLDTICCLYATGATPTGSKDPFAIRRTALGITQVIVGQGLRIDLLALLYRLSIAAQSIISLKNKENYEAIPNDQPMLKRLASGAMKTVGSHWSGDALRILKFLIDRLKVQQREAGVRHDLIDAVFALGGEDDLVRLLARVKALQAFVTTADGANLLAGYKRAANILKKENSSPSPRAGEGRGRGPGASAPEKTLGSGGEGVSLSAADAAGPHPGPPHKGEGRIPLSYTPEPCEADLIAALDSAVPRVGAAIDAEEFERAMIALASLRGPIDAFFDAVTVNDPDDAKRTARLALLARFRDAVHRVADFSKIEG